MDKYDSINLYCRSLGHYVPFKYCRSLNNGLPCQRIKDCTYEILPIEEFLMHNYSPEQLQILSKSPQSKIGSILEIIEKVKK